MSGEHHMLSSPISIARDQSDSMIKFATDPSTSFTSKLASTSDGVSANENEWMQKYKSCDVPPGGQVLWPKGIKPPDDATQPPPVGWKDHVKKPGESLDDAKPSRDHVKRPGESLDDTNPSRDHVTRPGESLDDAKGEVAQHVVRAMSNNASNDRAMWNDASNAGTTRLPAFSNSRSIESNGGHLPIGGIPSRTFVPAPTFEGSIPGFVFKTDRQGVGYYWDPVQAKGHQVGHLPAAESMLHADNMPLSVPRGQQQQSRSTNPLQNMTPEQEIIVMLTESLRTLSLSSDINDAIGRSRGVLQVLRELQMRSARTVPDITLKVALVDAIKWALQQVLPKV
jgi:hypothetical protein